jgi:hypothetical protein
VKIAGGFVLLAASWGPLNNLFAEYQDSPQSTYLILGLPLLLLGLALIVSGFRDLARAPEEKASKQAPKRKFPPY